VAFDCGHLTQHKAKIMKHFPIVCLCLTLLVSGCGEQIASEVQRAAEQVKTEASKAAVTAINDIKTDAITRLKKVQEVTGQKDKPQEKNGKNEDVVVQK
jgi:hypothetical protein